MGSGERDKGENKRKDHQGIKDPWTNSKRGRNEGRRWGWMELRKVVVGKWRQMYLNNNEKIFLKRGSQPLYKDLSHAVAGPMKREEWRHNLLPFRAAHRLIKGGHCGCREVAVPRKT